MESFGNEVIADREPSVADKVLVRIKYSSVITKRR